MTVSIVGTPTGAAGFAISINQTVPSTATTNDLVIILAACTRFESSPDPSTTNEWVFLTSESSSWDSKLTLRTGIVGTDFSASEVVAIGDLAGSAQNRAVGMMTLRSSTGNTPAITSPTTGRDFLAYTGDTSPIAPSISIGSANGMLLFLTSISNSTGAVTTTPPSGYSEVIDSGRTGASVHVSYIANPSTGTSGTATSTASLAGAWNALHIFASDLVPGPTPDPILATMSVTRGA